MMDTILDRQKDRGIPKVIHYCWFGKGEKPPIVQDCIKSWKEYCPEWCKENGKLNLEACTYYNTNALEQYFESLKLNDKFQVIDGNAFMSTGMYNQVACHHYASSWTDLPKNKIEKKREWKDSKIKRFLRNPDRQRWVRSHTGERVSKIYTFIAYDLTEMGLTFYLKRWCKNMF